jgi:hypothetical protein
VHFLRNHQVRIHFGLIMTGMILFGMAMSRGLLGLRVYEIVTREAIVFPASYLFFFCLVKAWLSFLASDFNSDPAAIHRDEKLGSKTGVTDVLEPIFGISDAIPALIVFMVFILLLFFLYWIIAEGPLLLTDAALEAALSVSLARASRNLPSYQWVRVVFWRTIGWFVLIYVVSMFILYKTNQWCPGYSRLSEMIHACWLH